MSDVTLGYVLAERPVETSYLIVVHVIEEMAVGVHRLRDGGVSK